MLLETILSPKDLKRLSEKELKALAAEIRERIIQVMAVNGGHLASNLGSVELTLALHRVFNSPQDKLIWDVSHQSYTHKILTGRNDRFDTIRQYQGLCGFCDPKESPHDHFYAGHAGTALSLALGCAKTRDLSGEEDYVIPIIGDATLSCGMSLEALNNIAADLKRFIVILNDNEMSISRNVGAITRILSRMLSNPTTDKLYHEARTLFPKSVSKITGSLKNLVSPAAFFEQYGLSYIGPIDGHDIHKLIEELERLKNCNWPIILHILTNKGHGMEKARQDPITYHGVKPFDPETGDFRPDKSSPTFPKVFGEQILKMADRDETITAVTPAMSKGSCLDPMMEKHPSRCLDVGIAEGHAVTFSGGLGYQKKRKVITSIYATFLQRAFDNLFHDVCLQEIPVLFCIDRAGISAPDGSTHHGIYDISFLNAMPNMVISQPRDGKVLRELMESSFSWERPAAIRYPNMATQDSDQDLKPRPLGKGELLAEGDDVLIIALGHMNQTALQAREMLAANGVSAAVMDPVFVKPLDSELICDLLTSHTHIVTLEEHSTVSGLGAILNHFLMTNGYTHVNCLNLGVPETFVAHGSYKEIIASLNLTPEKVAQRILQHISTKTAAGV